MNLENEKMIPKIIHQIHMGKRPLSEQELKWQNTWKEYNPEWEFILWDDEKLKTLNIINEQYLNDCDNYSMKSDILRFDILFQFGGLYIDTDFECLKPIDPLFGDDDFIFYRQRHSGPYICGAFLASTKHNTFVKKLVDGIDQRTKTHQKEHCVQKYGPAYVTNMVDDTYGSSYKKSAKFDPTYVYPFLWKDKRINKKLTHTELKKKYPDAFAAHWWNSSWQNDES
jgi:mannosyltransferase OCH1-like enzyme